MTPPDARSLPHGLAQLQTGRSGVAASREDWIITHPIGMTQGRPRHDLWTKVALILDTIGHYAPVLIARLSIKIRRADVQGGPNFFPPTAGCAHRNATHRLLMANGFNLGGVEFAVS
jgi:hypothetical protein